jgi:restriction system protein
MSEDNSPLMPHGGYRKLRAYRVAEAVYDATVVFCNRFVEKNSRTHDQMVQAARSGTRNISEGSGAAATSKKSEMLLTNVARANLSDELLKDYESFLRQRDLPVWDKDSHKALAMRERLKHDEVAELPPVKESLTRLTGLNGLTEFVSKADPELAANAMLCAVNQAAYLLKCLLERQSRDFVKQGGFTERLYQARTQARAAVSEESPPCPLCGGKMCRRTAGKGPNAGKGFWGCSRYPECRGTVNVSEKSDRSDPSDKKES